MKLCLTIVLLVASAGAQVLSVPNGGTGNTTVPPGTVLTGNGTGALAPAAPRGSITVDTVAGTVTINGRSRKIIDISQPPYNAVGNCSANNSTGCTDDTAAIKAAVAAALPTFSITGPYQSCIYVPARAPGGQGFGISDTILFNNITNALGGDGVCVVGDSSVTSGFVWIGNDATKAALEFDGVATVKDIYVAAAYNATGVGPAHDWLTGIAYGGHAIPNRSTQSIFENVAVSCGNYITGGATANNGDAWQIGNQPGTSAQADQVSFVHDQASFCMYGSGFISFSGNALDLNLYNTNIFMNHVGLTTGATTNWGVWGGEWDDNEIAISAFGGGPLVFDGVRSETTKRLLYFPNAGNARPTTIRNWSGAIPWDQATTYLQDRATVTAATYTASPLPNNPGNGVLTVPASTSLVPLALAGGFVEGDSFVYFQDISHYGLGTVTGWSNRGSTLTVSLESFAPASGGNVNLTNATITSYLNCTVSTTAGTANITLSAPCIEGQENYAIPGAGPGGADLPFYGFVYDSATTGHWSTAISVAAATVTNVRPYSPLNHWGQHQIQVGGGGPYFLVNNQFGVTGHFSVSPTALVVFNFEGNTWPLGEHPLNPAGLYPWPVNPYYSWLTFWSWTRNTWDLTAGTANVNPPVPGSALMPDKASINGQLIANGLSLPGQAGDPAAPANGDVWYNSTTNTFRCMQGGAVVNCIGSVGGTGASDPLNSVQFNNAGNLGGSTGFTYYPDTNPTAVHANNTLNVISHVGAQAGAFFSMDDGTTALPPGTTTDYVVGLDINATMNQTPAPLTGNNEGAIGVGTTVTSGTTQTAADYTWGLDFVVQSDDKPAINCIRGNCRGAIVGIGGDMFTVTPLAATQRSDVYSNKISGLFNNYYSDGTTVSSVGIDWGHFALMVSGGKSWFNGDIVLQPEQAATLAQNVYLWPSTKAVCNASTPGSIWIQGLEQSLGVNPIVTGGTGWAVGNTFTISGPSTVTVPATGVVTQAPGGVVTDFNYTNSGQGYVDNIAAATTATSGTGTGLVLNIVAQTNRGRIHYENNAAGDIMEVCENTSNGYAWVNVGAGGTSPFSITNGSNSLTFTVPPTGSPIISSSTGTVNLSYLYVTDLAGTGTACLQADNLGNVSRTTAPCGTGTAPTAQFLDSQVSVDAVASPAAPWWIGTRSTWLTLGTGSSGGPMTATSPLAANWATALAAGSGGGMYNTNYIANGASNPRYSSMISPPSPSDITNTTIRVGLYSSASVASLSPADPAGLQFVGFRFVAGTDTNWMCESKDGTTGVYTNSGVLVSPGVWYKLAVVFNNVAHTVDYFIGNALSGSPAHVCGGPLSANLPAAGTVLYPFTVTVGNGTAAENIRIAFVQLIKDW